jgi:tRNA pseudouridine55 synthase
VISQREVTVTPADIERVQQQFTGKISQTPPMYSALKKDGKPLYEYARAGIEIERAVREVTIFKLKLAQVQAEYTQNAILLIATVSKGTYIRTLGEDIGEALGCGAHLTSLRRIDTGGLSINQAVTLPQLEAMNEQERMEKLQPVESLLAGHKTVILDSDNAGRFLCGMRRPTELADNEHVAVFGDKPRALLGSAHIVAGELIPTRLLSPLEITQILAQTQAQPETVLH